MQLQLPQQKVGNLSLTTVPYTIPIFLWQSLPASLETAASSQKFPATSCWIEAAVHLADDTTWTNLQLSTPETLASFFTQLPCDAVPSASRLVSQEYATVRWDEVKAATQPLLYLIQGFQQLHVAGTQQDGKEQQTGFKNTMKQLYEKMLHAVDKSSESTADKAASYSCCLRAIVLMLKMLHFLTSIKLSDLTLERAITSLRSAVAGTSQDLAKHMQQMTGNVTAAFHCQKTQALTAISYTTRRASLKTDAQKRISSSLCWSLCMDSRSAAAPDTKSCFRQP